MYQQLLSHTVHIVLGKRKLQWCPVQLRGSQIFHFQVCHDKVAMKLAFLALVGPCQQEQQRMCNSMLLHVM
eukprot:NODE_4779_length_628_cov_89.701209_g4113_i0.p2 GENE.NODE_4779_length_628_cov_89.701209_g4113_i0~~NODE_4779_length_628_cov_89.701209_g4113_i0.p2  ORF type:complete len:71 (-),score=8.11 NODE_4779_length_628_cov_89.701209_g4113_i0:40-252(-)